MLWAQAKRREILGPNKEFNDQTGDQRRNEAVSRRSADQEQDSSDPASDGTTSHDAGSAEGRCGDHQPDARRGRAQAAPVVIAKGYDEVAQRIKAIAAENGIVLVENVTLARALAKELDVGDPLPVKWYQAVAEILSMIYKLKKPAT